ncbi:Rha family transcriptional regulator [Vibrio salinus]|uniref:Rha family transcriptional regulator n=1 Tax=Vibrio salinus TaxID=2899784 RepID=UPI001E43F3B4|nr:Rha family transcriptional regulator [Vibrio salinus]MCE0495795.1 Rha family transcriptional regulator [Vibrio salinus]
MTDSINSIVSSLSIENNLPVVSSKVIADQFGKSHKDILRAIKNLGCSQYFRERNFAPSFYEVITGNNTTRRYRCYSITKDGFAMTVMGFTGKKADLFKEAYINAFNAMERQLVSNVNRLPAPTPIDDINFMYQRWLVVVENGVITNKRLLNGDELIMNRHQFINYFKEPDIAFNDIDQLIELSNSVNERIRAQIQKLQ